MSVVAQALWIEGEGRVALREARVEPKPGEALVRTLWSGVSRGTERLVLRGRVPEGERARMRAPMQAGEFPFPVKYGYAAVGVVEDGAPALLGRTVFCLHPHQSVFSAPSAALVPVPDAVPARRAVLAANMETALNAVWDGGVAPGDRVAIIGAGALGLLTAAIVSRIPGVTVTLRDVLAQRCTVASHLGVNFSAGSDIASDSDIAFHASATAGGLATAISCLGPEGCVVEMSWHGAGETAVPLGGAFHSQRLRIISSQVGALPPARRPRWDYRRRLETALRLLDDPRLDALIDEEIGFDDAPARYPASLLEGSAIVTALRYG